MQHKLKIIQKPLYIPASPQRMMLPKPVIRQPHKQPQRLPSIISQPLKPAIYKPPKTIRNIVIKQKNTAAYPVYHRTKNGIMMGKQTTQHIYVPPIKQPKSQSDLKIQTLANTGQGRILVIIAAGPSIKEMDFTKLLHQPLIDFMCVNKPYPPVWPSKFWSFCDISQYKRNQNYWENYTGIIINSPNVTARKPNQIIIKTKAGKGFTKDITTGYHVGRSTTYASMQVANYMNYNKIYLFGVDMNPNTSDQLHWYGKNDDVSDEKRKQRFVEEANNYLWAGQNLPQEIREKYTFCSSYLNWPFTDYFKKTDHKIAIDEILEIQQKMLDKK